MQRNFILIFIYIRAVSIWEIGSNDNFVFKGCFHYSCMFHQKKALKNMKNAFYFI